MGYKQKDLTGLRFNKLYVQEKLPSRLYGNAYKRMWKCLCDCGKTTEVNTGALTRGATTSCGCYHNSLSGDIGRNSRHKVAKKTAGLNVMYSSYRSNALKRNHLFELSKEKVKELFDSPCHYCGTLHSNIYDKSYYAFKYNGIDRIDNSLGYTEENCVPCCKICNHAKHTLLQEDFVDWIKKAYLHLNKDKLHE